MSYVASRQNSSRATGVITVVALHVVIIYALATGLGRQVVEIIRAPLETRVIDDVKPPPEAPPPPPPKLTAPPPTFVPLPDFKVQTPAPATAITAVTTVKPVEPVVVAREPAPPPAPVVRAEPVHTPPAVDPGKPCAKPEYPSISKRMEETGTVRLLLLVGVDGSVVDAKVDKSSTFSRLDNAALKALQLCQFKPGTADGKPEQAWTPITYTFKPE